MKNIININSVKQKPLKNTNTISSKSYQKKFFNPKTQTFENCTKIPKGNPCRIHTPKIYYKKDYLEKDIIKKLTHFERALLKMLAPLLKISFDQAKKEYAKILAKHILNGVIKPTEQNVGQLNQSLLEFIRKTGTPESKKFLKFAKRMVLGESFTEAGFWATRDMLKKTLKRMKNTFAGGILASTLFVTACSPGSAGQGTQQEQVLTVEEYDEQAENKPVDPKMVYFLFPEPAKLGEYGYDMDGTGFEYTQIEGVYDYSFETVADEAGSYKRVGLSLTDQYLDSIPEATIAEGKKAGFTEEEVKEAISFYVDFALNETIDSIAADNPDRYLEWWDTVGKDAFHVETHDIIKSSFYEPWSKEFGKPVLDFHAFNTDVMPGILHISQISIANGEAKNYKMQSNLVRDGESRVLNKHITQIRVNKISDNTIYVDGVLIYASIFDYDTYTKTKAPEDVHWLYEEYYNQGNHFYEWAVSPVGYTLTKDSNNEWKIVGFNINYHTMLPDEEPYEVHLDKTGESPNIKREDLRYMELESTQK